MDGNVKLAMEKFELLKAMHTLVMAMNDEDAYFTWINAIPDGADDAELMEIAADDDEEIYRDACHTFRRICGRYMKHGFYLGGYGRPHGLYGAKKDNDGEEVCNMGKSKNEVVIVIRGGCLVNVISNADVTADLIDFDSIEDEGEEAARKAEDRILKYSTNPEYKNIW